MIRLKLFIVIGVSGYNGARIPGSVADTPAAFQVQDFPVDQIEAILVGSPKKRVLTLWWD